MAIYTLTPSSSTVHGSFSKEHETILSINSGDTIKFSTLDAGWGQASIETGKRVKLVERRENIDGGHALCGPIYINGAKKGMTLEVKINQIIPGTIGFTSAGQYPNWQNQKLGLTEEKEITLDWQVDAAANIATTKIKDRAFSVKLSPFMGIFGMPPDESGNHSTFPPRPCGGNLDCKELTKGSTLYLPIPVDGGWFSLGDGHAAQGDGEISGQAIECPMELVDLTFTINEHKVIKMPQAQTPAGWITFGFHEDLNEATVFLLPFISEW
ncbi:acetamidase [Paenibacillus psychroresistens]|uniref:Acetamidase n=1 Tax=Paenibacillus psychroresistens TaxID=1778678 RepID=A0A6B8RUY8_9BACL|nr:acetamidase/formamidase family protein [Paenibacillus psychroresistens]QGQ99455.1 acetamidase [Paenibacillus psychroresistens]